MKEEKFICVCGCGSLEVGVYPDDEMAHFEINSESNDVVLNKETCEELYSLLKEFLEECKNV